MIYNVEIAKGSSWRSEYTINSGIINAPISTLTPKIKELLKSMNVNDFLNNKYLTGITLTDDEVIIRYALHCQDYSFPVNEMYQVILIYRNEREFWINELGLPDDESWCLSLEINGVGTKVYDGEKPSIKRPVPAKRPITPLTFLD